MVYVDTKACNGCGLCIEACPHGAIKLVDDVAVIAPELCRETGACLEVCPLDALLLVTEPEEKETIPIPVTTTPLVKQAPASISRPQASVGAWLGAALVYLVSDVAPMVVRSWMDKRRRPSTPARMDPTSVERRPRMGPNPMGGGRCGGKRKLRRRRKDWGV